MRFARSVQARRLAARLWALATLLALYHLSDWTIVREIVRTLVVAVVSFNGHAAATFGDCSAKSCQICIDGTFFQITRGCTWTNVALTLIPFAWRFDQRLGSNAIVVAAVVLGVLLLDTLRLALVVEALRFDVPWRIAHEAPELALRYAVVATMVFFILQVDRRRAAMPRSE